VRFAFLIDRTIASYIPDRLQGPTVVAVGNADPTAAGCEAPREHTASKVPAAVRTTVEKAVDEGTQAETSVVVVVVVVAAAAAVVDGDDTKVGLAVVAELFHCSHVHWHKVREYQ